MGQGSVISPHTGEFVTNSRAPSTTLIITRHLGYNERSITTLRPARTTQPGFVVSSCDRRPPFSRLGNL